jgi:hypothetical protein
MFNEKTFIIFVEETTSVQVEGRNAGVGTHPVLDLEKRLGEL